MADPLWDDSEPLQPALWTVRTKRPDVLDSACCPCCGRRPASLDPLPAGWCWDTMEPSNPWIWCSGSQVDVMAKTLESWRPEAVQEFMDLTEATPEGAG